MVAHRQRDVIGTAAAARQRGFCKVMLSVIGVGALAGWWRCHGVGAGALVLEGEGPDNQNEVEGGRGEGNTQHDKQHDKEPGSIWLGQKTVQAAQGFICVVEGV